MCVLLKVKPAGAPTQVYEFPEWPLEVSACFPKEKKHQQTQSMEKYSAELSMTGKLYKDFAVALLNHFLLLSTYKGEVKEAQHNFVTSVHIGGRL